MSRWSVEKWMKKYHENVRKMIFVLQNPEIACLVGQMKKYENFFFENVLFSARSSSKLLWGFFLKNVWNFFSKNFIIFQHLTKMFFPKMFFLKSFQKKKFKFFSRNTIFWWETYRKDKVLKNTFSKINQQIIQTS